MGMPLPPLFKAEIKPISLSGFIEKRSGKVDLQFDAEISPSVTSLMVGTPLKLFMNLTTGIRRPPLSPHPSCQADKSAVSDGGEDQGAEEVTVHGAIENRFRPFWKPSLPCERLSFQRD